MFVVGILVGYFAQSTGVIADALDMATDAVAYALALMAIRRGPAFKRNSARWSGLVLIVLGGGIVALTGFGLVDLVVGFAIGVYVLKEAIEILHGANEPPDADRAGRPTP